jgi:hypothetical protein
VRECQRGFFAARKVLVAVKAVIRDVQEKVVRRWAGASV